MYPTYISVEIVLSSCGSIQSKVQTDKQTRDVESDDDTTTYTVGSAPDNLEIDGTWA
jgi:hypothetical protein